MATSRLEAFSDGVFAIAITLLIIEVRVPDSKSGELARDLANQWPSYAAYLVSFVIIGIIWVNHHDIFERITTDCVMAPPPNRFTPRSIAPGVTPVAANMTSPLAMSSTVKQRFGSA